MIRRGLLLAACLAAAGAAGACARQGDGNSTAPAPTPSPSPSYTSPNLSGGSWEGVFADPKRVLPILGRLGLRPGPYEKKGDGWRSDAPPTPLTDPSAPDVVTAQFAATGGADRIDTIAFNLVEPAMSNDQRARDAFDKWIRQVLGDLGVTGADSAVAAIHGDKRMAGQLKGGADYRVTRTTTPKERRVAVTFTRSAAMAGQTNQGSK